MDFHLGSLFTSEVEVGEGGMTFLPPFFFILSHLLSKECKVIQYLQQITLTDTSGTAERVQLSEWQWLRCPTEMTVIRPKFSHGKLPLLNLGYETVSVSKMQLSRKSNKGKRNSESFSVYQRQ